MESEASVIRSYQCQMVPGLLQTEGYARAAIEGAPVPIRDDEIERQVALRIERQAIVAAEDHPTLLVILDEGAVRRLVGGAEVMRDQIDRLVRESTRTRIRIQLLPFSTGTGFDGSFVMLDFPPLPDPYPDAAEGRLVYVDTLTGALYLEGPAEVSAYSAAFEQLAAAALAPRETRDRLRQIAREHIS